MNDIALINKKNDESTIDLGNYSIDEKAISYINGSRIPKILFQTWKNSKFSLPDAAEILHLRSQLVDLQYIFHDDASMTRYMLSSWSQHPICSIFLSLKWGAAKADIWRYCILYEYGGIYLDIDSSFDKSLLDLIDENSSEIISAESNILMNKHIHLSETYLRINRATSTFPFQDTIFLQWLLIFEPKHPVLAESINLICKRWQFYKNKRFANITDAIVNFTGPAVFSEAVLLTLVRGRQLHTYGCDYEGRATFKSQSSKAGFYTNSTNTHYQNAKDGFVSVSCLAVNISTFKLQFLGFRNLFLTTTRGCELGFQDFFDTFHYKSINFLHVGVSQGKEHIPEDWNVISKIIPFLCKDCDITFSDPYVRKC